MIPRIRAKVGKIDNGEYKDKWAFEISLWTLDGEKMIGEPFTIGPWDTKEQAHTEMKSAVKLSCEAIEKANGCDPSGKFLDMKNGGILRPWTEQ